MKTTFWKYLLKNSRNLLIFCLIFIPLFTLAAFWIDGKWSNEFTITFGVAGLVLLGSIIGDYIKWTKL